MANTDWHLLRTKTGFTDDTDHVDVQTDFFADVDLEGELLKVGLFPMGRNASPPNAIQVVIVWIDNAGEVLSPDSGTTRGTFDIQALKVLKLQDDDSPPDQTTVVVDGAAITSCQGYRVYVFDGMSGDNIWFRLTNITQPSSGNPAKIQVWVQPVEVG